MNKINVKDLAINAKYPNDNNLCIDDWDTCKQIQEVKKDYDSEKGFINYEVVIQRLSDGRFFKFIYTQFGHNGNNILEQIAYEVFPKTKTVTHYK